MTPPKLRAYIVEHDPMALGRLLSLLKNYFPEVAILGSAQNAVHAKSQMHRLKPDIVFLDIALKRGCGFQIIERCRENCSFIITTKTERYALRAISLGVIAYLLKPLELKELLVAINRAKQKVSIHGRGAGHMPLGPVEDDIQILALPSKDRVELVNKKNILYLKAEGRYTNFLLSNGETKLSSRNLGSFANLLDPNLFIRPHHSYIVNIVHVKHIDKAAGNYLELQNGNYIPVSKRKLEALNKFLKIT